MAEYRWSSLAIRSLHSMLVAQVPAELRLVETEEERPAGTLLDPRNISRSRQPAQNYSPFIQVYDRGFQFQVQKCRVAVVQCEVSLSWTVSPDLDQTEDFCRAWQNAVIEAIIQNPRLDGSPGIIAAIVTGGEAGLTAIDDSQIRHMKLISVDVHVHSKR